MQQARIGFFFTIIGLSLSFGSGSLFARGFLCRLYQNILSYVQNSREFAREERSARLSDSYGVIDLTIYRWYHASIGHENALALAQAVKKNRIDKPVYTKALPLVGHEMAFTVAQSVHSGVSSADTFFQALANHQTPDNAREIAIWVGCGKADKNVYFEELRLRGHRLAVKAALYDEKNPPPS